MKPKTAESLSAQVRSILRDNQIDGQTRNTQILAVIAEALIDISVSVDRENYEEQR